MKIAYFSPLPPKRTGVAGYSRYLIPALTKRCEIHLFDNGAVELPAACPLFDYVSNPQCLLMLDRYDSCIYHLGNNPWDHSYIYDAFLYHPGIVVLHDVVLFYLFAGRGRGALLKELCMQNGPMGIEDLTHILATSLDG